MTGRDCILNHLDGRAVERLPFMPITMMFAADQIGQPYGRYVRDFRVLVEGQIATAERFGIDYVSAISDPAREAHDCGAEIRFFDDQPPAVDEATPLLGDKDRLRTLRIPDPATSPRMSDRLEAVRRLREQVGRERLVEGWIEGPCAEAADLRGINHLMLDFFDDPEFVVDLLDFVTEMEISFALAQLQAGAELIGVGDAAASLVGPKIYREFIQPREKRMVEAVHAAGGRFRLHICGDTRALVRMMAELGCDIVDLDYPVPMEQARKEAGRDQMLLGNLHPVETVLAGPVEKIERELDECWRAAGPRYIVGAGCEIPRGTPPEHLAAMGTFARRVQPTIPGP
ncbi:MAG TPA: uroporphyrinogen decarboxylase family protein [Acidobacteriota bacterium]|mgnify:CR=1 FL=1|jgi:MtaA/CmuA family methyltransferase|nr:uroporphyrinogen decarboxylase family protein [Acidobacteriota bacterium]